MTTREAVVQKQVELYEAFIDRCQNHPSSSAFFIEGLDKDFMNKPLTLTVTPNCSCGRFFEQHPTIIEDTEEERLGSFLENLDRGYCKCLTSSDGVENLRISSKTWIHVAAALGCLKMVEGLVSIANLNINAATSLYHFTALSLAVMQTKEDLISWLCAQPNIDINVKSKNEKHTPLIEAMLAEKFHIVEILSQTPGVDLNTRNFRGETPLVIAVRMNNARLVKQLLAAGADYSIPNPTGILPFMLSVNAGHQVVKEFVDANVPLNTVDNNGESALTLSLRHRALDIVDLLIWGGADTRANPALPALILAAKIGHLRTLVYLLDMADEDPNQKDDNGWTALHYSSMNGFPMISEILLDRGLDCNCVTSCLNTPLSLAVFHRHHRISELLISYGAEVNCRDVDLDTPMHYAAINGDKDMVRHLLNSGAAACVYNRVGATPLFNAVISGNVDMVKIILPYYTDVDLHANSVGFVYNNFSSKTELQYPVQRSVLWIAADQANQEMITLLLFAGFNASLEEWIHNGDFPEFLLSDDFQSLRELLIQSASNPCPLLSLCRCVVRRALGPGRQRQVNQLNSVPRKVKNYISLREL